MERDPEWIVGHSENDRDGDWIARTPFLAINPLPTSKPALKRWLASPAVTPGADDALLGDRRPKASARHKSGYGRLLPKKRPSHSRSAEGSPFQSRCRLAADPSGKTGVHASGFDMLRKWQGSNVSTPAVNSDFPVSA